MQKCTITLSCLFCIFLSKKIHAQKCDLQIRYFSEITGFYTRLDAEIPIEKKFALCGGVSKDALQMVDITGKYQLTKHVQIETGIGYHKQNGIHFVYGLTCERETDKLYFEGYFRGYADHKSLYASEAEIFYKPNSQVCGHIGFMWDIEYGKHLPLWVQVTDEPSVTKTLFLGGVIYQHQLTQKVSIKTFCLLGQEKVKDKTEQSFSIGFGLKINLKPETHHY